jgi:hypothetical protein
MATRRAISSTGTPCSLMIETNVWRGSRGVQWAPILAFSHIFLNARRTCDASRA